MERHAVRGAAKGAGLDQRLICELMGPGGDGRIEAQPLPNVGYRHADGRIRRMLVVAPGFVDEEVCRSVVSRLVGAALVAEAGDEPRGVLAPIAEPDPMLARYRGGGAVVDDSDPGGAAGVGWPSRSPAPGALGEKAPSPCRHLRGASRARRVFAMPPRLRGSAHPLSYRRPRHLARHPCLHLSVEWTEPVRGPLALGAGTGYGLGLFVPVGEEFLGQSLEVTSKEVEPAGVAREGDGIRSSLRA